MTLIFLTLLPLLLSAEIVGMNHHTQFYWVDGIEPRASCTPSTSGATSTVPHAAAVTKNIIEERKGEGLCSQTFVLWPMLLGPQPCIGSHGSC